MSRITIADLPLRPEVTAELSDAQLDQVAGGWGFSSFAAAYSYSYSPWAVTPIPIPQVAVTPIPIPMPGATPIAIP